MEARKEDPPIRLKVIDTGHIARGAGRSELQPLAARALKVPGLPCHRRSRSQAFPLPLPVLDLSGLEGLSVAKRISRRAGAALGGAGACAGLRIGAVGLNLAVARHPRFFRWLPWPRLICVRCPRPLARSVATSCRKLPSATRQKVRACEGAPLKRNAANLKQNDNLGRIHWSAVV